MIRDLLDILLELPTEWVYAVIALLAGVENIFPPVPADTAVAVGAFLSVGGRVSAFNVFLITWTANVFTASLVYAGARTAGRSFFRGPIGSRLLRPKALARIERLYEAHGVWAIFLSRFIPAVRAVVPPFAGVAGLGAWRALVPMALASAIWYGTLTFIAATAIQNVDEIVLLVQRTNLVALVTAGVLVISIVVAIVFVRRQARGRG